MFMSQISRMGMKFKNRSDETNCIDISFYFLSYRDARTHLKRNKKERAYSSKEKEKEKRKLTLDFGPVHVGFALCFLGQSHAFNLVDEMKDELNQGP